MLFSLRQLRFIAIAEGISYLSLALTMLLKYQWDILWPNKIVGWVHGMLFILYVAGMTISFRAMKWRIIDLLVILIASVLPFMTFWVDRKYLREGN